MGELKPCPFCGAKKDMVGVHQNEIGYYQTFCYSCGVSTTWYHTRHTATLGWNRRVNDG